MTYIICMYKIYWHFRAAGLRSVSRQLSHNSLDCFCSFCALLSNNNLSRRVYFSLHIRKYHENNTEKKRSEHRQMSQIFMFRTKRLTLLLLHKQKEVSYFVPIKSFHFVSIFSFHVHMHVCVFSLSIFCGILFHHRRNFVYLIPCILLWFGFYFYE